LLESEVISIDTRIKQLRKALDLTQQEFADRLRIKRNTVAMYETGRNIPIDAVISLICKTFNVREDWLRYGEGDMFIVVSKELELMAWAGEVLREESSSFRHRFVAALSTLDAKDWEELERLLIKMTEALEDDSKK
jgi:transcriptional regulator with XRE-family HTH domain